MVALLATGGSTNHLIHWVAVARAAGIVIDWNDFSDLSDVVPLLTRVYPNGSADVNEFQAAGGPGFVIARTARCRLMHADVRPCAPAASASSPASRRCRADDGDALRWSALPAPSKNETVVRPRRRPFSATGGLKLLTATWAAA